MPAPFATRAWPVIGARLAWIVLLVSMIVLSGQVAIHYRDDVQARRRRHASHERLIRRSRVPYHVIKADRSNARGSFRDARLRDGTDPPYS